MYISMELLYIIKINTSENTPLDILHHLKMAPFFVISLNQFFNFDTQESMASFYMF